MTTMARGRLEEIVDAVGEQFGDRSFARQNATLVRTTAAGGLQVVYFYLGHGGAPVDQGGVEWQGGDSFKVVLGARITSAPPAEPFRSAYPADLGLDVSVGVGEPRRRGSDPDFRLSTPNDSIARLMKLLEPYGRRWFQRYATVDGAIAALEALHPLDSARAGQTPALVLLRLYAGKGDRVGAQRVLDRMGAERRPGRYYEVLAGYAAVYGLDAPRSPYE